jgi:hypothetical protein
VRVRAQQKSLFWAILGLAGVLVLGAALARVLSQPRWVLTGILMLEDGSPAPDIGLKLKTVDHPKPHSPAEVLAWLRSRFVAPVEGVTRTDGEGRFTFQVPAGGYYEVTVVEDNWFAYPMDVTREPPEEPVIWVVEHPKRDLPFGLRHIPPVPELSPGAGHQ